MEFIRDCIGNKVRVGDEILYVAYHKGYFSKNSIHKVAKVNKNSVTTDKKQVCSRFIKVIREEE